MKQEIKEGVNSKKEKQFMKIVRDGLVMPVYQPIISLQSGEVFGYEALSRITLEDCLLNPEEFFIMSQRMDCLWKTEELCRKKSLKGAIDKPDGIKLFLNVDPNVMEDPQFRKGVTCSYLKKYNIRPDDIVFEITEKNSIENEKIFCDVIQHYRSQNFEIAIDDFGNGYAGMNRICALHPLYVKIDIQIVRDIDKDSFKRSLVESMVQFCNNSGIYLIAEGIETRDELKTLIRLGVHLGQGYYLSKPTPKMKKIPPMIKEYIANRSICMEEKGKFISLGEKIGNICTRKEVVQLEQSAKKIYSILQERTEITEMAVVNDKEEAVGLLTRTVLQEAFGGLYGYNLSIRKNVCELMKKDALIVDCNESVETVSKIALQREQDSLYDAIIVTDEARYKGVVTVKELFETVIAIQVNRAENDNPLTRLPGNAIIDECISKCLTHPEPFSIVYIDMDNFKAYNDAYGFHNGDAMIQTLAKSLENICTKGEFLGHIGGDDFVIITDYWEVLPLLENITKHFQEGIISLYKKEDYARGYIISKNRKGETEQFPIVTLSMAIITNRIKSLTSWGEFSQELAKVKKESKERIGNSYVFF